MLDHRPHASTTSTRGRRPAGRRSSQAAAPDVWVELAPTRRASARHRRGRRCARSPPPRASIEAPARSTGSREGVVFVPFHYGYWDAPTTEARSRRERADDDGLGPGLQAAAVQDRRGARDEACRCDRARLPAPPIGAAGTRMNVGPLLACLHDAELALGEEYRRSESGTPPITTSTTSATRSRAVRQHAEQLAPFVESTATATGSGRAVESFRAGLRRATGSRSCGTCARSTLPPRRSRSPG